MKFFAILLFLIFNLTLSLDRRLRMTARLRKPQSVTGVTSDSVQAPLQQNSSEVAVGAENSSEAVVSAEEHIQPMNIVELLRVDGATSKVFNAAFLPTAESDKYNLVTGFMLARYLQGPDHYQKCGALGPELNYNEYFAYASVNPALSAGVSFAPMKVPSNVVCANVGEPKLWILHGRTYVTSYTNGQCPESVYQGLPSKAQQTYKASIYGNYIFEVGSGSAVRLHYDDPIEQDNPTAKNFLFFDYLQRTLVVTLISPHKVYMVDLPTGRMVPAFQTFNKLPTNFNIGLNAGPVRLDNSFLVAAHISHGGWGGHRLTFFYTFSTVPPFEVLAASQPFSFGMSDHLEYVTGMVKDKQDVIISLGVEDCKSSLIRMPVASILQRLYPIHGAMFDKAFDLQTGHILMNW